MGDVLAGDPYGALRPGEEGAGGESAGAPAPPEPVVLDAGGATQGGPEARFDPEPSAADEGDHDREAGVHDRGGSAEFAVRRGSRGRRGRRRDPNDPKAPGVAAPGSPAPGAAVAVGEAEREAAPRPPADANPEPAAEAAKVEDQPRPPAPPAPRHQDGRGDRRAESYRRPEQDRRADQDRRPDQGSGRRGDRSAPPTISELLHEGQEILVQIAKEPIAKKSARITSHIALPGRYLVY